MVRVQSVLAAQINEILIFLDLPQQPIVVTGSVQAALDLMDKRSSDVHSDKPVTIMDEL